MLNLPFIIILIINNFIVKQADKLAGEPAAIMIIYDPRMYAESILWFIIRRFLYQGWPTLSYDTYQQAIDQQGEDFFQSLGIEEFYYIAPTDKMILESVQNSELNQKIVDFEKNLQADNLPIDKIYNLQEQEVFNIYRF